MDLTQDAEEEPAPKRAKRLVSGETHMQWCKDWPWLVVTEGKSDSGHQMGKYSVCLKRVLHPQEKKWLWRCLLLTASWCCLGPSPSTGAAVKVAYDLKRHADCKQGAPGRSEKKLECIRVTWKHCQWHAGACRESKARDNRKRYVLL